MPRYFFDIRDGEYLRDEVGTDLPDIEAARVQAVVLSGGLLQERPSKIWDGEEWRLEVRKGPKVLFALTFMATSAPDLSPRETRAAL